MIVSGRIIQCSLNWNSLDTDVRRSVHRCFPYGQRLDGRKMRHREVKTYCVNTKYPMAKKL